MLCVRMCLLLMVLLLLLLVVLVLEHTGWLRHR
jgi:hypothetical protein